MPSTNPPNQNQIKTEATSVLYGDNTISINISQDAVHAHNIRCGPYSPDVRKDRGRICLLYHTDFTSLVWPDFLYRARHLSISVRQLVHTRSRLRDQVPRVTTDNTLYSLCLALRDKGVCRRVEFHYLPRKDESIYEKCNPFQILGVRFMQKATKDEGGTFFIEQLPSTFVDSHSSMVAKVGSLHHALTIVGKIRAQQGAASVSIMQKWLDVA